MNEQLTNDPHTNAEINKYLKKRDKLTNKLVATIQRLLKSKKQQVVGIDNTINDLHKRREGEVENVDRLSKLLAAETGEGHPEVRQED